MSSLKIKARKKKRNSHSKLNQAQIDAAYKLYEEGLTVPDIAELIWKERGYSRKQNCVNALYFAFWLDGKKTRSPHIKDIVKRCAGCGCHLDDRTKSCGTCRARHSRRKVAGRPRVLYRRDDICPTCKRRGDENRGCGDCYGRRKNRKKKAERARRRARAELLEV